MTLFIGLLYGLQDDAIPSAQKPYLLSFSKQSYGGVKIRSALSYHVASRNGSVGATRGESGDFALRWKLA